MKHSKFSEVNYIIYHLSVSSFVLYLRLHLFSFLLFFNKVNHEVTPCASLTPPLFFAQMRGTITSCLVATLTVGLAAVAALDPVIVKNGAFFDSSGRQVLFRGVNVVYKDPPWIPTVKTFHSNLSFVEDDAKLLASVGVNLIRLGIMWPGVNPSSPHSVDLEYIEKGESCRSTTLPIPVPEGLLSTATRKSVHWSKWQQVMEFTAF